MRKKINGYIKWVGTALAIAAIIWNAIEIHYNAKKNNAVLQTVLQNEIKHLAEDVTEIKLDVKEINRYLLTERGKE